MKKIYFIITLVMATFTLHAQRWINLTYTNTVTSIARTGTSWWVGTTGGLMKYDTADQSVTLYNCGNSELPADYINDLTVDDNGTLWVATHNGLARHENGPQFSVFSPATGSLYSKNVLFARYEKGKGLWIATDTALTFYDGNTWLHYFEDDQGNKLENISYIYPVPGYGVIYANDNQIKSLDHNGKFSDSQFPGTGARGIAYDAMNNLYVADWNANGGFYEQTSSWNYFDRDNSPLPDNQIYDVRNDGRMNVYFLHNNGFSMKTGSGNYWNIETENTDNRLDGLITTAIYPDTIGALGLAGGLLPYTFKESYDGGYSSYFTFSSVVNLNKSDLESNSVWSVIFRNGKKYIGTRSVSIWDVDNHLIKRYNSVSNNPIGSMDVDIFGRIWCADRGSRNEGTGTSFAMIDHGKVTDLKLDSILGFPISGVDAIQWETTGISGNDTTGKLWISYYGNRDGIAWYNGKTWNTFPDTTRVPQGFTQFVTDNNGVKWFATMGGIYSYDGKKLTDYWNIAPIHQATCVAKDKNGNLWFGGKPDEQSGWKGGLAKFDGSTWILDDKGNSSLPDMYVTSIAVDSSGTIWAGTHNGGILKMKWPNSIVISQGKDSPLDNNDIVKIAVDIATNDVWIINRNAGIFVYNENGILHTAVQNQLDTQDNNQIILNQHYPNPFTESTTFSFIIPKTQGTVPVSVNVYNIVGQKVKTLVNSRKTPGKYSVQFHAVGLIPGIYFYQLKAGNYSAFKKMLLIH